MFAKMKCSNCGAEMSNMQFNWGMKHWLIMIPIMLLGFVPLIKMMFFKPDIATELSVNEIRQTTEGSRLQIIGQVANQGRHTWSGVSVQVEFFDKSGAFAGEETSHLGVDIQPATNENFKIACDWPAAVGTLDEAKIVVKIAGGYTSPL